MSDILDLPGTALATVETMTAVQVFAPNAVAALLDRIEREARAVPVDISTPAGRKACASLAYEVAKRKTFLDKLGLQLTEADRERIKRVNAERNLIEERMDALKAEVRKPLTDWENREKARVADHEAALDAITEHPDFGYGETAADLQRRLDHLNNYPERDWQEFAQRAEAALTAERDRASVLLAAAIKREAEAAELARLRAEEAERARLQAVEAQRHREAELARKAAETARVEAEQRAERERIAAEQKVAQERQQAAERERLAKQAAVQAEQRAQQAERDRVEALAKAERDRVAAEQAAERRQAQAVEAERRRVQEAQAAEARERDRLRAEAEAEAARRAANKAHRQRINQNALTALVLAGITEDVGKLVISAIARGDVPAVSIAY